MKNIEKRIQRQVVLEDGRVIEEDLPEVTVDTVEDIQSHSDDCDDDIKNIGGSALIPVSDINIIFIYFVYHLIIPCWHMSRRVSPKVKDSFV